MKELSIKEKAKRYDEAIENGKQILNTPYTAHWDTMKEVVEHLLPELKESEDDKIRKELLEHCKNQAKPYIQTGNECPQIQSWIDWLEKQGEKDNLSIDFVLGYLGIKPAYKDGNAWCILLGDNIQEGICGFGDTKEEALIAFIKELIEKQGTPAKLSEEEQNRFAKCVLTSCAASFIDYLDAHKYEGKMCVSNGECEDIENAFHNAMWDKLHRYYCKYIEKQSEKPQGKSAFEAAKEEKIDNQNCVNPADKVEPKYIKKGERKPNPYSGTSFEYNGHTWGMCARDNGVEILIDGHLKARVFTNDNNAKEMFIKALERVEEQNSKGYKLTDCDKNSWWEDFKVYMSCTIEQKSIDDLTQQGAKAEIDENYKIGKCFTGLIPCWVNAPSTQQPAHDFHGKNIVAIHLKDGGYRCCCIDDKKPVTFTLAEDTPLVEGWNNRESSAWSEEDKNIINHLLAICAGAKRYRHFAGCSQDDVTKYQTWLKSLRPQTTWKPSDEQMKAIEFMVRSFGESGTLSPYGETMAYATSLLNDLKKL